MPNGGSSWGGMTIVLLIAVLGLLVAPIAASAGGARAGAAAPSVLLPIPGTPHSISPAVSAAPASAHPNVQTTFPRTVLIETFTAVWCIHCPAESSALYAIDQQTSHSKVAIAELHTCAYAPGTGPCLENYVPWDNTTTLRGGFYNVCGYPDVFFDGQHDACGASNSEPQMYAQYESAISNASVFPGYVAIAQHALVQGSSVVAHVNITSGLTGNYNVVSYLLEYVNKLNQSNGYGPHDLANVVRETLHNHPASLTTGATTGLTLSGPILSGWNQKNLSVITLVQNNSSKAVENTNFAPVETMSTMVGSSLGMLNSTFNSTISLRVFNSSTGAPVAGAGVLLTSSLGGTFTPVSGATDSMGTFSSVFTAPDVTATANDVVAAFVTAPGYTESAASTIIVVNPNLVPAAPKGLAIVPGVGQLTLTWSASISPGGGSLTYSVFLATAPTGPFYPLGTSATTSYLDMGLVAGQVVWFEVAAKNTAGLSPRSSAIEAAAVAVGTSGLPGGQGWWIQVGSQSFFSPQAAAQVLFLPPGAFTYTYGATSYAWTTVAQIPSGSFTVASTALWLNLSYTYRAATLSGTVDPVGATVTLNGVALTITNGAFFVSEAPGNYYLNATSSGYVTNSSMVTLTPGNVTSVTVHLQGNSPGTTSLGGLNPVTLGIIIGPLVTAIAAVGAFLWIRRSRAQRDSAPSEPEMEPELETEP